MPTAAEQKAQQRAAQELTEALRELEAANSSLDQSVIQSAGAYSRLAGETNEAKQAAIEALQAQIQYNKAHNDGVADISRYREIIAQLKSDLSGFVDIAEKISDRVRGMWGISSQWTGDITASLVAARAQGKSVNDVFKEMGQRAETVTGRMNVLGSRALKVTEGINLGFMAVLQRTMSLVGTIDQATVSFRRATGATEKYVSAIPALESKFRSLALSGEDAAAVMGSLFSSMSGFTRLGPGAQKAVRETAAVLSTLGIDAEVSAQNMELLNRSMGFSGSQAANITQQLFGLAQQLDISTSKMLGDFSRLGPELTVYGRQAINVFARLEAAAKESGIEVERLLSIAQKFDTFKGAADAVGQLNAVLGGPYLSVMRMVQQTDPTQRMQMLSQATRQAGLSFDTMAYYERRAIAEAMGLQDVNELALVMKGRFDLLGDSINMNSNQIEKLARENQKYKTIQQELTAVLRELAVPATKVLKTFQGFLNFLSRNSGAVTFAASAFLGLKTSLMAVNTAAVLANAGMTGLAMGMKRAVPFLGLLAAGTSMLAFTMLDEGHSDPLFARGGGMTQAAQQTYGFANALQQAGTQAAGMAPQIKKLATDLKQLPDSKMVRIEKVMSATEGVYDASKGASITAASIGQLARATAGGMGGQVIQNHMDVTVEMKEKVVGHVVARAINRPGGAGV